MCFYLNYLQDTAKLVKYTQVYSEISDMIKFCGVPGKILSKSQQFFYGYNEIGYNECMDKQTDFEPC